MWFLTLLSVALGYEVFQLSSPQVSYQSISVLLYPVLQQSKSLPLVMDYAFMTWIKLRSPQTNNVQIFSCIKDDRLDLYRVLLRLVAEPEEGFLVETTSIATAPRVDKFPWVRTGTWEHITLVVTFSEKGGMGELSLCISQWRGATRCLASNSPRELPILRDVEQAVLELGKNTTLDETQWEIELVYARFILGTLKKADIMEIVETEECAEVCRLGCWGPSSSSCSDYVQLLPPDTPQVIEYQSWDLRDPKFSAHDLFRTGNSALTGWFDLGLEVTTSTRVMTAQTRECEVCKGAIGTCSEECQMISLYLNPEKVIQACLEVSYRSVMCLDSHLVDGKQWHFISISYSAATQLFELCMAAWEEVTTCSSQMVSGLLLERKALEMIALGEVKEGLALDIRYFYTSFTFTRAAAVVEEKRKNCKTDCPLHRLHRRHAPRHLQVLNHSSLFDSLITYAGAAGTHYYTFVNNHVNTIWMRFNITDNSSPSASYSVYLYKPWTGSIASYDWSLGSSSSIARLFNSTDSKFLPSGDMTGSYTLRIDYPASANGVYLLFIYISCSNTTSACFCSDGYYPNPTASSCSACAANAIVCPYIRNLGCITMNYYSTSNPSNIVNCDQWIGLYLGAYSNYWLSCDTSCSRCIGSASNQCVACHTNYGLSIASQPSTCVPCDNTCASCTIAGPSGCSACYNNALLSLGTPPSPCVCNSGYYGNPTASSCIACGSMCAVCSSAILCTTCIDTVHSIPALGANTCLCTTGYYRSSTAATCALCDNTCLECIGQGPSQCSSCKNFAMLSVSVPSVCQCSLGSFPAPDSSNCEQCAPLCQTCTTNGSSACTSCKAGAFLSGPSPNTCQCNPGFFPNPDISNCLPCLESCASCSGASSCITCKHNAKLENALCICVSGFYGSPDASNCITCSTGCLSCSPTECTQCDSQYLSYSSKCVLACPIGYKINKSFICEPADMTPPTPTLIVTPEDNLIVVFDKPMNFAAVTSAAISVDISIPNAQVNSASWSNPTFNGTESMMVNLTFQSSYMPAGSEVNLTFLDKEVFIDEDNATIWISSLKGTLYNFGSAQSNSTSLLATPAAQQTKAGVTGGVSAGATASIINMNPQSIISMVNQLQLMSYIALTNISLPQDFASTLAALNMGSLLSGSFSGNIPTNYTSQVPPQYMQNYGISSTLFLPNTVSFLGTSAAVLLSYIPIYLLSKIKNERVSQYFGGMMPSLIWGVPLQLWMTSYLDIGIYSSLQLLYVTGASSDIYILGNVILALLFSIIFIATPLVITTITYRHYNSMVSRDDASLNKRWGVLYMNFRASGKYTSVLYYSYFTIRRFLFAVTLIFFQNSVSTILLVNLSM